MGVRKESSLEREREKKRGSLVLEIKWIPEQNAADDSHHSTRQAFSTHVIEPI